jgi:uncharacterized protein (DUF488 family)
MPSSETTSASCQPQEIFTIGHSNLSMDQFVEILKQHQITTLADVRSHPYSRYVPHFNQKVLKTSLPTADIRYVFWGKELGARPADDECYVNGIASYNRIAASALFMIGIQRLLRGVETHRIALMCAEKDPLTCHRAILICRHLKHPTLKIQHILRDGGLESHEQLEARLLAKFDKTQLIETSSAGQQLTLFDIAEVGRAAVGRTEVAAVVDLEEAYRLQGSELAIAKPDTR